MEHCGRVKYHLSSNMCSSINERTMTVPRQLAFINNAWSLPTGSISIDGGAAYTASTSVTLALTYSDVSLVRYSNDGVWDSELWESPSASRSWILLVGDGEKTV